MKRAWIPVVLLCVLLAVFRWLGSVYGNELPNFSPFAALFFCGAAYWAKSKWTMVAAFVAWLVTNPLSSMLHGYSPFHFTTLVVLVAFAAVAMVGYKMRFQRPLALLGGSVLAAVVFYLITNLASFAWDPQYSKDLKGLTQALWTGGSYGPTWPFFRNSLISNVAFTSLWLAAIHLPFLAQREDSDLPASQPHAN